MPLRLAPSSPERMAAMITELWSYVGSGLCRGNGLSIELAHERCVRLLLRWYAAGVELAWECPRQLITGEHTAGEEQMFVGWYGESWANRYDHQWLPDDWRERLRKELGE